MLNFKEELKKYQPLLEVDKLENSLNAGELQDMLDMLQYVSSMANKERPQK